ncbi:MAG: hypothetical protein SRB1_02906 [Desulfobacteraceae bacterium Eth-SRB1]|nr:MAG: hypothetical protein SRB1_02906 [Desulfobacteraceae bacterium Eth-SRB1]
MGKKPTYEELEQRIKGLEAKALEGKQAEEAPQESERFLQDVFNAIKDGISVLDLNLKIVRVNPWIEEMYSKEGKFAERKCYEVYQKRDTPCPWCPSLKAIETGETHNTIVPYPSEENPTGWIDLSSFPLRNIEGDIVGVIEYAKDITERKRAEEELRNSEKRLEQAVEGNSVPTFIIDINHTITHWNKACENLTGFSASEAVGTKKQWLAFYHEERPVMADFIVDGSTEEEMVERYKHISYNKSTLIEGAYEGENFYPDLGEKGKWIFFTAAPLIDQQGKIVGAIETFQDVSKRKQAEEKIKEYSESLENMVEVRTKELRRALYDTEEERDKIDGILKSIADGLIVTDQYNRIILMNRVAEELLGVRFSEVIDRPIDVATRDKSLKEFFKSTPDKTKTELFLDFELPGKDKKHPRIIRAKRTPIKDKKSAYVGTIILMEDVTREHEIDRMKTELISTAAHELKTPLTSIQGYSELLISRDDIQEKETKEFLTYINDRSRHLAAIVNNMLYILNIESGLGIQIKKESVDMTKLIRESVSAFQERYPDCVFKIDLPEGKDSISLDREKMGLVLENLLSNAVKFSSSNTAVAIRGEKTDKYYQLFIEDEGIGMTTEQADKVFDKFYRADMSSTAVEGAGLGMTIVKYIIEAHNGTIHVKSQHGKGTVVKFLLKI